MTTETTSLPPTYQALPTTKLEEEPNPFEQSFEIATIPTTKSTNKRPSKYNVQDNSLFINHTFADTDRSDHTLKKSKTNNEKDEEKRKNFLERNRIAALKCRQRKKQWLENLQLKVEYLTTDNEQFQLEVDTLKKELIELKAMLMQHKNCPINQQALLTALNKPTPQ